jgi:hypothetical protein
MLEKKLYHMREVREIIPECSRLIREVANRLEAGRREAIKDPHILDFILGCEALTMDHVRMALDRVSDALERGETEIEGY